MYHAVDACMIRASVFTPSAALPAWPDLSGDTEADVMPEHEVEIIESGRAWMAGQVPDDVYFSKVIQSAAASPGEELLHRVRALIARFANWRKRST